MDDGRQKLEQLREEALASLIELGDYMVSSEDIGYDTLLALARTTNDPLFLEKALRKVQSIDDDGQKSDGLIAVLDQIEANLSGFEQSTEDALIENNQ